MTEIKNEFEQEPNVAFQETQNAQASDSNDEIRIEQPIHASEPSYAYTPHEQAYTVSEKGSKKSGRYGIGALILTSCITVIICAALCFGIVKFTQTPNSQGQQAANNTPTPAPTPNSTASQGLIIGGNSASSSSTEATVLEKSRNTVVSITVQTVSNTYYYGENVSTSSGSGVIITTDGYIVTCNHVVEGGTTISVALQDGTVYEARIVGHDSRTDLAVIKIEATNLPAATLGNSGSYKVGDKIYAIGNPLGEFASTVTDGIISGVDRTVEIDGTPMQLMQTNAAINPGNSGGGLFSAETGELIGIVNAKNYGIEIEGLGFAIPTSSAQSIIKDLMDLGYVTGRPYIGIQMQTVTMSGGYGGFFGSFGGTTKVRISAVSENSPAAKAGIQAGDFIVSFDGTQISTTDDISSVLNKYNSGDKVSIVVERNGQNVTLELVLGEASGK